MLESIFKAVLYMSALGTVISLLLIIAKPLTKRIFTHRWNYYIRVVIVLIMLIPFSAKLSPSSEHNKVTYKASTIMTDSYQKPQNVIINNQIETKNNSSHTVNNNISWLKVLSRIWIVFALFIFTVRIIQYQMFIISLRKHCKKGKKAGRICVKYTDLLYAPLTVGLFKKTILIPQNMQDEENEKYILKHELSHIKNKDITIKWLCTLLKTVHWFNPAVYYISNRLDRECEYVCDITSTENMNDVEKKQYMNTILSCIYKSHCASSVFSTRMAEYKNDIVKRFEIITTHKKQSFIKKTGCFCVFIVFIGISISVSAYMGAKAYDKKMPAIKFNISSKSDVKSHTVHQYIPQNTPVIPPEQSPVNSIEYDTDSSSPPNDDNIILNTKSLLEENTYTPPTSQIENTILSDNTQVISYQKDNNPPQKDNISSKDNIKIVIEDNCAHNSENNFSTPVNNVTDSNTEDNPELTSESENETSIKADIPSSGTDKAFDDVSYPGDMVGYITLEDWNSEKMVEDLENTGCFSAGIYGMKSGSSYICGEISYESGNTVTLSDISPSDNGRMCVYLDSEYQQLINIAFIYDGKQISASSFVPDGKTFYVFAGFDPCEKYNITISNPNGSTWKTTAQYVVC